ncbi:hypothetical protein KIL84_019216, partial [Mauremys mutica]
MASLKSFGRAGQREEEENGDLDRSLQQMLRAIVEERNRINIRQEISGLGYCISALYSSLQNYNQTVGRLQWP